MNWSTRSQDVALPLCANRFCLVDETVRTDLPPTHPSPRFSFCSSSRPGVYPESGFDGFDRPKRAGAYIGVLRAEFGHFLVGHSAHACGVFGVDRKTTQPILRSR